MCVETPAGLDRLDGTALFAVVSSAEAARRRLHAADADVLSELWDRLESRGGRRGDLKTRLVDEHGVSTKDAARREAVAMTWRSMPRTAAALRAGEVSFDHVVAMARAAGEHPEVFTVDEADLVAQATRRSAGGFAVVVDRWVKAHDPDNGDTRTHRARRRARADRFDAGPDMVGLVAEFANLDGARVWAAIEAEARRLWRSDHPLFDDAGFDPSADTPTAGRYRAGAVHNLICGDPTSRRSVGTHVVVVATVDDVEAGRGGELLDGTQVCAADLARALCTSPITGLVFSAEGEVLWHGHAVRLATTAQKRAVHVRDRHCTFPGCDQPAHRCDAHHLTEHHRGGPTDIDNLTLLCVAHHTTIHTHHWTHTGTPGHDLSWHPPHSGTSPRRDGRRAPPDKRRAPPTADAA